MSATAPSVPTPLEFATGEQRVQRARTLYRQYADAFRAQVDRRFFWLFLFQWVATVAAALAWCPEPLSKAALELQSPLWRTLAACTLIVAAPLALTWALPGKTLTRMLVAICQMLFGTFLIQFTGGKVESQFHIFGSLAFLALYRDWRVVILATLTVLLDQSIRTVLFPETLFGIIESTPQRLLELAGGMAFENIFLLASINLSRREMQRQVGHQTQIEALMETAVSDSRREAETIMATVSQGLCLLGTNFRIGGSYSQALEEILGMRALQNQDFLQILRSLLPPESFATAKDYLGLMFDVRKKEKQLTKINPLQCVEVTPPGGGSKHLEFRFSRIEREKRIAHLLVAVTDVTDKVRLEQQLKQNESAQHQQLDLLLGVLHVEPAALQEFIASSKAALARANAALREEAATEAAGVERFRPKLDSVAREVHALKGNAALLQLPYFHGKAHAIEEVLQELRSRTTLTGADLLTVVVAQAELEQDLTRLHELVAKFAALHRPVSVVTPPADKPLPAATPSEQVLAAAANLVDSLCAKLGKAAVLVHEEFDTAELPPKYQGVFREIVAQLVRNSLAHGIEPPEERTEREKHPSGVLELRSLYDPTGENCGFAFRDDGRGLNLERLRAQALALGLLSQEKLAEVDEAELATLIFEPGFSTAEQATEEAGRGVGMDIIKSRVVDELGGEIQIHTAPGEFTEFHIILPS